MNGSSLTMFNAQRMPRKIFYHVNKWASNKNTSHRFYFDVRLFLEECRIVKSNVQHIQSVKSRQELWILLSAGKCVCLSLHLCTEKKTSRTHGVIWNISVRARFIHWNNGVSINITHGKFHKAHAFFLLFPIFFIGNISPLRYSKWFVETFQKFDSSWNGWTTI